ncbi:hypothetical protein FS749_009186 [Ceratobasidium sp. UAMH 11750]|nr:hypothetical protein FS749_009186 [Ceratobasidium sp. UAMH 11750]
MSETYTVTVRSEPFVLTRDQIEFDSPNYFTSCFLGEFAESQARTATLSRDPDLFRIVLDYLSGYKVLPLHESAVTKRMGNEVAISNLLVDAQFYQLDGLISMIEAHKQETAPVITSHLPSHVIISLVQEEGKASVWSPPVPIPADTAQEMKNRKGFDDGIIQSWDFVKPGLDKSLQTAQFPTSYLLVTSWGQRHPHPYKKEFFYVLKLAI